VTEVVAFTNAVVCLERKEQHTNIKAAIKLYEEGKIDDLQHVFIMEGRIYVCDAPK
jgi:hypothetical protein